MSQLGSGAEIYKSAFLEMFPEDCQKDCIVAKIAAANAARSFAESGLTFDKYREHYAHRFGRCALGPEVEGRCGKKSICQNPLVETIESPVDAAEALTDI